MPALAEAVAPDPVTQERLYRAIKQEMLAGAFRPGARIDLQEIADRYRASTTPVREAAHRLIGEQLLEPHTEGGIQLAIPDEASLRCLYAWNGQHLLAALRVADPEKLQHSMKLMKARGTPIDDRAAAERAASIFQAIAESTGNATFASVVQNANERLHYPRLAEAKLFGDAPRELATFTRNGQLDVRQNIGRRLNAYHRRRVEHVADIGETMMRHSSA